MSDKRILNNTMALYFRQVVVLVVNLYSVRIVLQSLGVEDFGVFSAVSGFVTLMSFLPRSMASSTQRFFSVAMGQGDRGKLEKIFCVNLVLYGLTSLVALLAFQTIGSVFVSEYMSFPSPRREAALSLYQFAVFGFVVSVFSSPFMASIIAHEDMHLYALISILEALLKLLAAFSLSFIGIDALASYGLLLCIASFVVTLLFFGVSYKKYPECRLRKWHWDIGLFREIMVFTGWTLFGQLSTVFRMQAVTLLINQWFSPATVAARAISLTVSTQAIVFSQHLNTGLYPPIVKYHAASKRDDMLRLVVIGSKLTFFLTWVLVLPLLVEMDWVLSVWLEQPPTEAALLTKLGLVEALILSLSLPLATAARASGRLMMYELTLGTMQFLVFPASWFFLSSGHDVSIVYWVAIIATILMSVVRLFILKSIMDFPVLSYLFGVLIPMSKIVIASSLVVLVFKLYVTPLLPFPVFTIALALIATAASMYLFGLDPESRKKLKVEIESKLAKLKGGA